MNCKDCEGHGWDEDTRGNMIVCKRCAGTGITLHPGDLAALAAANGYVKLEPGQVAVRRELLVDAHTLLVINNCDCNPCTRVKSDLLAALDASGGKT